MQMPETGYDFYFSGYCGGRSPILEKEDFDRLLRSASQMVGDYITLEDDRSPFEDKIRRCVCRVAEALFKSESRKGIKSENIDGYSVTYADEASQPAEIRRIVVAELADTGLVFAGVERC